MSTAAEYIIIGGGAAGLQLILKMLKDPFFEEDRIILIEPSDKDTNDRTWCFWEKGPGPYEEIVHARWPRGRFSGVNKEMNLDMGGYEYKMIRAIDFYNYAKEIIQKDKRVSWVKEKVKKIEEGAVIYTEEGNEYTGRSVFDSRIPHAFSSDTRHTHLKQHFVGWVIETQDSVFDPEEFHMMDFKHFTENETRFTYVLPLSDRKALVEYTLFTENLLEEAEYEKKLSAYIEKCWDTDYKILDKEQGVIPMTDYPFHHHHSPTITKIGTAGGWVKPSSGYSFKISQKYINDVIGNIKMGNLLDQGVAAKRHRFYDRIFLKVLKDHNDKGPEIFQKLYEKNPTPRIFRFLDEDSALWEEILIMSSFINKDFTKALWQVLTKG